MTWSPLAIASYDSIINYLHYKFGETVARQFVQKVDDRLKLIVSRPKMFRATGKRRNTYLTSIQKKVVLIYRYKPYKKELELVVFWGMQDPAKKPL